MISPLPIPSSGSLGQLAPGSLLLTRGGMLWLKSTPTRFAPSGGIISEGEWIMGPGREARRDPLTGARRMPRPDISDSIRAAWGPEDMGIVLPLWIEAAEVREKAKALTGHPVATEVWIPLPFDAIARQRMIVAAEADKEQFLKAIRDRADPWNTLGLATATPELSIVGNESILATFPVKALTRSNPGVQLTAAQQRALLALPERLGSYAPLHKSTGAALARLGLVKAQIYTYHTLDQPVGARNFERTQRSSLEYKLTPKGRDLRSLLTQSNPAKAPDKDGLIYLGLQDGYRHEYQHPETGCVFAIEKFERSPHERRLGLDDFWGFYRVDDDATDAGEGRVEDAHPYYSDAVKALRWWVTHATFDPRSRSWSYLGEK